MYVNPIPFGIFIGIVSTLVAEVVCIFICAAARSNKK